MADTPTQQLNADNEELAQLVAQQSNQDLADDLAGTKKSTAKKAAPTTYQNNPIGAMVNTLNTPPAPNILSDAAAEAKAKGQAAQEPSGAGQALLVHPKQEEAAAKAEETKQKNAAAAKKETAAQEAQVKEVAASPWTQLGNSLATQYQQAETPAASLISGAQTVPGQNAADQTALALLGESGSSPDASTLGAWAGAADAATAPVAAAEAAQGAQYSAEAGPITKAIMAYGQANALSDETAPEASWLQALASHVTSNLSYYGEIPTADVGVLEQAPGVATALQQAGGYGGETGSGLTPLQDVQVQNGKVSVNKSAANTPGTAGTVSTATAPAPGVSAGS
jgi:hypothetical protein